MSLIQFSQNQYAFDIPHIALLALPVIFIYELDDFGKKAAGTSQLMAIFRLNSGLVPKLPALWGRYNGILAVPIRKSRMLNRSGRSQSLVMHRQVTRLWCRDGDHL